MQAVSGDVGSASRRFDSSYSANVYGSVYGSIGMTADFFVAYPICFEALSRAVTGTN
jgi:hypothetical protein